MPFWPGDIETPTTVVGLGAFDYRVTRHGVDLGFVRVPQAVDSSDVRSWILERLNSMEEDRGFGAVADRLRDGLALQ